MAILSCHVSIKLPPKISDGQNISENAGSSATNDPECRILRMVSRLFGNLDAARSAIAVRLGTTHKVGNRNA